MGRIFRQLTITDRRKKERNVQKSITAILIAVPSEAQTRIRTG